MALSSTVQADLSKIKEGTINFSLGHLKALPVQELKQHFDYVSTEIASIRQNLKTSNSEDAAPAQRFLQLYETIWLTFVLEEPCSLGLYMWKANIDRFVNVVTKAVVIGQVKFRHALFLQMLSKLYGTGEVLPRIVQAQCAFAASTPKLSCIIITLCATLGK